MTAHVRLKSASILIFFWRDNYIYTRTRLNATQRKISMRSFPITLLSLFEWSFESSDDTLPVPVCSSTSTCIKDVFIKMAGFTGMEVAELTWRNIYWGAIYAPF